MADNLFYTDPGSGSIVAFRDNSSVFYQRCDVEGMFAHDADASAAYPVCIGGFGKATAPTDVSATGDATKAWCLLNGSFVVNLAVGGTLVTGSAGLPVAQQGTWNIGTVTPGSGATNLGKAIDTALGATDTGVLAMAVRDDALATLTEADNDVSLLRVDSTGRLWCNVNNTVTVGSHAVTNAGVFVVQSAGTVAHDSPAAAVIPVLIGGFASAAAPTSVSTDGDSVQAWYLRNGAQATVLTAAGALIGGDATNGIDCDITRVKPDGTNTMPSMDVASRASFNKITDGTLTVGAFDETGTNAIDALAVGGGTPHDSVDSGCPIKVGYRAIAHGTNPTAVAAADRSDSYCNRAGIPFVMGGHPNIVTVKHTTITTAVTDAAIITVSGGTKIVVTAFTITLDNASTVFPTVLMGFATTNTPTTTGVIAAHGGVPAGGGFSRGDGSGILGIGADGEDLRITTTGNATGNGLQVVVTYYTIES